MSVDRVARTQLIAPHAAHGLRVCARTPACGRADGAYPIAILWWGGNFGTCMSPDFLSTHGLGEQNSRLPAREFKITNFQKVGPAEVVDQWWGHTWDVCGSDDRIGESLGHVTDFHNQASAVISTNSGLVPSGHAISTKSPHQVHQRCDPKLEPEFQ